MTRRSGPEPDLSPVERRERTATLVRLARRAGEIAVGVRLGREAVRAGRAAAVLVADDLGPGRRERLAARCREAGVPIYGGWTKDGLGELTGRPAVAVLTITDRNVAAGIAALHAAAPASRTTTKSEREE